MMTIFSQPRSILAAFLWFAGLVFLMSCGSSTTQPAASAPAAPTSANAAQVNAGASLDGQQLFVDNCAKCHGLEGLGNGTSAGSLSTAAGMNLTILQSKSDDELFTTVSTGKGSEMPPWELVLSPEQRSAIIKYVRTLAK